MNNSESSGHRGVPSARKSIHDHEACIFANCSNMGRYGLKTQHAVKSKPTTSRDESDQEQGVDEVDNVMSKMARQSSPQRIKNRYKDRRNSFDTTHMNNLEYDSDSDKLAKSLPADMPSYYCSDEFPHRSLPTDFYKAQNSTSLSSNRSRDNSNINESRSSRITEESVRQHTKKSQNNTKVLLPLFGLVCLAVAIYYQVLNEDVHSKSVNNDVQLHEELDNIKQKYHLDENSMLELQTGISTISEKNDTGSFVLVYSENSVNFDQTQFNNFLDDITVTTAKYLRNTSRSLEPTIVHSSQLTMKTHSELMNRYRNEVAKTGVMLVKDVDTIPSRLAMAFHYFCDEYNPLVAKTAIFFTLNMDRCKNSEKTSTYTNIEKCLSNKWDTVPKDNIRPLLARIVNVIIDLSGII